MTNSGSIDSMDKSQLNSSMEDNRSYDVYEAHNPRYSPGTSATTNEYKSDAAIELPKYRPAARPPNPPGFDLSYRNEGFRNHSTFAARDPNGWGQTNHAGVTDVATPDGSPTSEPMNDLSYLNNASTLPLNSSLATSDSISEMKRELNATPSEGGGSFPSGVAYDAEPLTPGSEPVPEYFSPPLPHPYYYQEERPRSEALLDANLDQAEEKPLRSKSEALLETNFDVFLPPEPTELTQLSLGSRSKSQPLETAM